MDTRDLGDKKINNEQTVNEGFSAENLPENYNPSAAPLKTETIKDAEGQLHTEERARNVDGEETRGEGDVPTTKDNMERTVENQDRNSDVAADRYPASHPENHHNRGNINTD